MIEETKKFFKVIDLEMNIDKLATNNKLCSQSAKVFEGLVGYKYLGVTEIP